MAPLLAKANSLKLKLEYYKNIDLKDENSKRKVLEEIMENIYIYKVEYWKKKDETINFNNNDIIFFITLLQYTHLSHYK